VSPRVEALHQIKANIPHAAWLQASQTLAATPTSDGTVKGSCSFTVGGQPGCVNNVSKAECDTLAGNWSPVLKVEEHQPVFHATTVQSTTV
jgi:hypothetical protein